MEIKTIYEDADVLVVDKPAGIVVYPEQSRRVFQEGEGPRSKEKTLIDYLLEKYPSLGDIGSHPRYGVVHRLDKDTSGVLLVAKSPEGLIFLQKRFKNREVEKKYVCLVEGNIENDFGKIETLIARAKGDFRKQKAYSEINAPKSAREAITEYKVLTRFKDYTLLEVEIKTGRRHQIRCHFSYLKHPIAGDKMYGFKNSKIPSGLARQFLHSAYLKIQLPNGKTEKFISDLPEELQNVIKNLKFKI